MPERPDLPDRGQIAARLRTGRGWIADNKAAVREVGLVALAALLIASFLPRPMVAPALADILGLTAVGWGIVAGIAKEEIRDRRANTWHQAGALLALAVLAAMFVDPAALS